MKSSKLIGSFNLVSLANLAYLAIDTNKGPIQGPISMTEELYTSSHRREWHILTSWRIYHE
jgi:hypothetical protein